MEICHKQALHGSIGVQRTISLVLLPIVVSHE